MRCGLEWNKREVKNVPLESLPFLTHKAQKKIKIINEWIRGTMKIWPVAQNN